MYQDTTWYGGMEVGLSLGTLCYMGTQLPPLKGHSRQFSANVRCCQTAGWTKMPIGTELNLGPGDVVLDGVAVPTPKRGTAPHFSVHVYYVQTAAWMKTPLGTEVDLGPGHIVLGGVPALHERGTAAPPLFSAHVYCAHGRSSQLLLSSCIEQKPRCSRDTVSYLSKTANLS